MTSSNSKTSPAPNLFRILLDKAYHRSHWCFDDNKYNGQTRTGTPLALLNSIHLSMHCRFPSTRGHPFHRRLKSASPPPLVCNSNTFLFRLSFFQTAVASAYDHRTFSIPVVVPASPSNGLLYRRSHSTCKICYVLHPDLPMPSSLAVQHSRRKVDRSSTISPSALPSSVYFTQSAYSIIASCVCGLLRDYIYDLILLLIPDEEIFHVARNSNQIAPFQRWPGVDFASLIQGA